MISNLPLSGSFCILPCIFPNNSRSPLGRPLLVVHDFVLGLIAAIVSLSSMSIGTHTVTMMGGYLGVSDPSLSTAFSSKLSAFLVTFPYPLLYSICSSIWSIPRPSLVLFLDIFIPVFVQCPSMNHCRPLHQGMCPKLVLLYLHQG